MRLILPLQCVIVIARCISIESIYILIRQLDDSIVHNMIQQKMVVYNLLLLRSISDLVPLCWCSAHQACRLIAVSIDCCLVNVICLLLHIGKRVNVYSICCLDAFRRYSILHVLP